MKVLISSPCSASVIIQYGIKSWPIWECAPSKFQWNYDEKEICNDLQKQTNCPEEDLKDFLEFISKQWNK